MHTTIKSEEFCSGVLAGLIVAVIERDGVYCLRTVAMDEELIQPCKDEADARAQFATVVTWARAKYH